MDVRQLRYFVVLAEELHFGRAAVRLHIAQPALSQQIRSLESELGLRLLDRTSRGVVLTDAGTRLLSEARGVLGRFDEAVETMRRIKDGTLGVLRIGVFPGPLSELLPPALVELRRQLPEVDAETRSFATDEQLSALLDARLDLALLPALEPLRVPPPLTAEIVLREPLGIAVPSALPIARKAELAADDLAQLPLVFMSRAASPPVYDMVLAELRAQVSTALAARVVDARIVTRARRRGTRDVGEDGERGPPGGTPRHLATAARLRSRAFRRGSVGREPNDRSSPPPRSAARR